MTIDINKLKEELGLGDLAKSLEGLTAAQKAQEAERMRKEQEEKELARMNDLVSKAVGEDRKRLEEALELVKSLDEKSKKSNELFAQTVEKQQETIVGLQDEIKSLLTAREGRSFVGDSVAKALYGTQENFEDEVEKLVLLSYVMEKGVFETEHGQRHLKAVNQTSSVEVSSESYETIFSQRIIRDLQKELVVGALFEELPMSSKILTMLVEPDAGKATWVAASTYGTDTTTGEEVKGALKEIHFSTYKLAAKSFITDETEEDAIFSLLPLLRKRLIEAHAVSIEEAFMTGDGSGKPKGLLTLASEDSAKVVTEAKA
ncbi:phage major capsid protein, partial [Enterococcus faecalis]|uniref:phage major capsid protein n=1 Tax=Enterococcus faecalis TaxID=1351 RepID=UPI0039847B6B